MPTSYLLDTSILVGLVTASHWSQGMLTEFDLDGDETTVLTSIVSRGEIRKLAIKRDWGEKLLARMDKYLREYPQINIESSQIIDAYAKIGAWSESSKVVAAKLAHPPKSAITLSQNDIWIAATAHALNLRLLSTDKDFSPLNETWIDFIYIDPSKE